MVEGVFVFGCVESCGFGCVIVVMFVDEYYVVWDGVELWFVGGVVVGCVEVG